MAVKTYHGSCHCGSIKFSVKLDLAAGTGKCNCTICQKTRYWGSSVKPAAFTLIAGEAHLKDYQFNTKSMHHLFCDTCGVRAFGKGSLEVMGGDFYTINLACLDDAEPRELSDAPVNFADGRHDNWRASPEYTKYL